MSPTKFCVGLTGDLGRDIYTIYLKGEIPAQSGDHWVPRNAAADVKVPAGTHYASILLKHCKEKAVLPDAFSICEFLPPKINSEYPISIQPSLVELSDYKWPHAKHENSCRIHARRPICDEDGINLNLTDTDVFRDLRCSGGATKVSDLDVLYINDLGQRWRQTCSDFGDGKDPNSVDPNSIDMNGSVSAFTLINGFLNVCRDSRRPRVIVNIGRSLPEAEIDDQTGEPRFIKSQFWEWLRRFPQQVLVICSAASLRGGGAAISRRLSWEQTAEDFATELQYFAPLRALAYFRHLIVRFGQVGAIHVDTESRRRKATLIFAPLAKDGVYRDANQDGSINGKNTLLATAILHQMASARGNCEQKARLAEFIPDAIRTGLLAGMRAYDLGYDKHKLLEIATHKTHDVVLGERFIQSTLSSAEREPGHEAKCPLYALKLGYGGCQDHIEQRHRLGIIRIPEDVLEKPVGVGPTSQPKWQIFRQQIDHALLQPGNERANSSFLQRSRINLGIAIVKYGFDFVLNWDFSAKSSVPKRIKDDIRNTLMRPGYVAFSEESGDFQPLAPNELPALHRHDRITSPAFSDQPVYVPMLRFGKLVTIERDEIESLYSIRNLIQAYLDQSMHDQPLRRQISIAVFGPPGSGKSFAVKEIAKSMNDSQRTASRRLEIVEYNVAQFRTVDDLADALTRVASINNEGKIPLVLFDEFDCPLDGEQLGWLRYFLAPMQDGTFYGAKQTISLGHAVFVFAGGIFSNFAEFDPSVSPIAACPGQKVPKETRIRMEKFREQKGPDFVSRLRGHINIQSVNCFSTNVKPIIRRAMTLRGLIEQRHWVTQIHERPVVKIAEIDDEIVYAMLTIDRYRHGTRSMEAILQMCIPIEGRIEKASLPSRAQLNMHVSADEFIIRMFRGRFRPATESEGPPSARTARQGKPDPSIEKDKKSGLGDSPDKRGAVENEELGTTGEGHSAGGDRTPPEKREDEDDHEEGDGEKLAKPT